MTTFSDKISAFLRGPGWFPGTPRLGDPDDLPKVHMVKNCALCIRDCGVDELSTF